MRTPILATKLYIPPPRPDLVVRPRLIERLNEGLQAGRRLTLISAGAGFGKTTLLGEWLAGCGRPAAWLSLEAGDNELARFLAYLVAALQTIAPRQTPGGAIGERVLGALQARPAPMPPPELLPTGLIEELLSDLLNELASFPTPFILVLDDYHVVDARPVQHVLTYLLDHLPPQMLVVIASREDPPLPLARLRARGQLTELRAADLRFTPTEAAEFLTRVMSLNLSAADITALDQRTEGWIAGLQLAALALQGGPGPRDLAPHGPAGLSQMFRGSHRFVLDYLVEEVLQRQPERVRNFLLRTVILDRLCGQLCDAVVGTATGQGEGQEMLAALERGNLFVVPLDDRRQWYRYHHLFADVLRIRLAEELPGEISGLHRRASEWYEANGLPAESIRHALAARDFERAADLIELAWSGMDIKLQSAEWLGWAQAVPDELIRARPVLSVGYASALLDGGDMEAGEARLQDAERWLSTPAPDRATLTAQGMVVADEEQFRSLPATIATARAYRTLALGDVPGAVQYARLALDLTPEGDPIRRVQASALLGLAQFAYGDLDAAGRSLTGSMVELQRAGSPSGPSGVLFVLADLKIAAGRLNEADRLYRQAVELVAGPGELMPAGAVEVYRGLSELSYERGDLEAANQHLQTAQKLGEKTALIGWQHRLCVTEARLKALQGDLDVALALLDKAERLYVRGPLPDLRPIAALKARVWLRQGRLAEALGWMRDQSLAPDDPLSHLREFEHITLARVLIVAYQSQGLESAIREAMGLLERLRQAAQAGGRMGSLIEVQALQALACQAQGDLGKALASLEQALTLAEEEGFVRLFVDEGAPMAQLLAGLEDRIETPRLKAYLHKLLAAFSRPEDALQINPTKSGPRPQPLIEPLSERELEVLKLLRTELSGPEIARQLVVSLSTVRTHTQNIYRKLQVNNRRAAVRRADELDLV